MKLYTWFRSVTKKLGKTDVLFIILSFVLLLGIFIAFRRQTVYITGRFKVTDENFSPWRSPRDEYALGFVVGDTERNEIGKVIAEIIGIESYRSSPEPLVAYESYKPTDQQDVYLDIRFRAIYNPRKKVYTLLGKNIALGEIFTFRFSNIKVKAIVVDFPGFTGYKNLQTSTTVVQAQLRDNNRQFSDIYGVPNYLANALNPGDAVTDSKDNVLARILEVQILPAKRTVVNNVGNSFQIDDPYLKDVYYVIELATKTATDKIYMFNYLPLEIGTRIPLYTKFVSVNPTITKILR